MKILKKWKKNKIIVKAINESNGAEYWINYETPDKKGTIKVYAKDVKEAKEKTIKILNEKLSNNYKIYDISAI